MKPSVIYTYSHVLCNNVSVNDRPRFRWWANKTVLDYKQKFIYDIERKGWTQLRCLITASSGWLKQTRRLSMLSTCPVSARDGGLELVAAGVRAGEERSPGTDPRPSLHTHMHTYTLHLLYIIFTVSFFYV